MRLKISHDGIDNEISFNSISNGQATKTDPNRIVIAEAWDDDIKRQIDQVLKEANLPRRTSDKKPSTTRPSHDVNPEKWSPMDTKSIDSIFEYDKQLKIERDLFKPQHSYEYNYHYDRGIQDIPKHDTRFDNIDFNSYMPTPAPPSSSARVGALAFRALGGAVGGILVLILLASVCKQKGSRRGVVITPRAAAGAGTVQPDTETHRRPSGQGGFPPQLVICQPSADPPCFDLPPSYSECITKNVSEPPPYTNPAETAPLVQNGLLDIGFRNDCVDMTTSPEGVKTELVFDNGRIVERLSLDLSKETGQDTKHADVKDRVVYVDENSTATQRQK